MWASIRPFKVPGGLTVTRTPSVTWSAGVATKVTTTLDIPTAAVWYLTGRTDRVDGAPRIAQANLGIVSETKLLAAGTDTIGDRFQYDDATWEVQTTRKWEYASLFYAEARKVP